MNSPYLQSALAHAAFEYLPPLIQATLLDDASFRGAYNFETEATLSFRQLDVAFLRSTLFACLRKFLADGSEEAEVADTAGVIWNIKNVSEGGTLKIVLSRGEKRVYFPHIAALSPNRELRLQVLRESASEVNLPDLANSSWYEILKERALSDDEFDKYHADFLDTPVAVTTAIRSLFQSGGASISTLVPDSERYYERLIGAFDGSLSIREFAVSTGKKLFNQLSTWRSYDGLLQYLLLSAHSSMTLEIDTDLLGTEDLLRALEYLDSHGDRTSQLGALELGLRILPSKPEIGLLIQSIARQIRDDDVEQSQSGFKLLSTLFMLVDGQLARSRVLSKKPPFYRRLASLAQASLIHRELVNSSLNVDKFTGWVEEQLPEAYFWQSVIDLREEPRWHPDFATGVQLKAEFCSRILSTAMIYEQNIQGGQLSEIVLGSGAGSMQALNLGHRLFLPGPLEGAIESRNAMPEGMADTINEQLSLEDVGPPSFYAIVNSALMYPIREDQAELAAKAIKRCGYRLTKIPDREELWAVLRGLALVAAVSRSKLLADELRILVRIYSHDLQYALTADESMRVCMVSAASRKDLKEWRDFVGGWLTELAFSDLEPNEGVWLYSHFRWLCHMAPSLWVSCGRADAALLAYNASSGVIVQ